MPQIFVRTAPVLNSSISVTVQEETALNKPELLVAIYTFTLSKKDNLLDLTIFLMLFLSFWPKLIKEPLILPEILVEKCRMWFHKYYTKNLLKRWDWALVFLVQVCNRTSSNICCCLYGKTQFNLKTTQHQKDGGLSKITKTQRTEPKDFYKYLYLSTIVVFTLTRFTFQWEPSGFWPLIHIKVSQREANLTKKLVYSEKVSVKNCKADVGCVAMRGDCSANWRVK